MEVLLVPGRRTARILGAEMFGARDWNLHPGVASSPSRFTAWFRDLRNSRDAVTGADLPWQENCLRPVPNLLLMYQEIVSSSSSTAEDMIARPNYARD
jgi:hypothetical protein